MLSADAPGLACAGVSQQGGLLVCRTAPFAQTRVRGGHKPDGEEVVSLSANADGWFVVGIDRDATGSVVLSVEDGWSNLSVVRPIAGRSYRVSEITGLPPRTVEPAPEDMAKINREVELKNAAFASRADRADFVQAFRWPLDRITVTSPWGAQRSLNGVRRAPHYGVDLRGPVGTPVLAPNAGVVILAETDMHFEGGMVSLDHGQGLISSYLHMSEVAVRVGEVVSPGARLGATGARGRVTGPHLCWRLRWQGRMVDPSLLPRYQAPPFPPPT